MIGRGGSDEYPGYSRSYACHAAGLLIYLLLTRSKLRNVIITLGEKAVLILGRFTERKELRIPDDVNNRSDDVNKDSGRM